MACAKVQEIDKTIRGKVDIPVSFPACKGNEGEIILPVMTDAAGEWYNVLIIERSVHRSRNIAELPTYNSTLACQRLFLHRVRRPHTVLGGSPQVKNMKESTHIVRCIAPLDETSLVLLDQTVNYLLQTKSKNFSIDF